jgi:U5 small nuclear ribonucleoprotein component
VLISGIDQAVTKTSTIVHASNTSQSIHIMSPLKFWSEATIKVAIEPLIPSELPKMIEAIRRVNKSYLMLRTKVEESGEHVLIGNG